MSATRLFLFTTFSLRTPNHKPLSLIPPRVLAQRFNFSSLRFRRYSSSVAVDAVTGCDTDSANFPPHHPWPEWVTFVDRLKAKGYFEGENSSNDESINVYTDMNLVKDACLSFARDRYDVFKSLPVEDVQKVVEQGCPNLLRKAVNSAKRLRAYTRLDEGDVCSACNLRGSCDRAYVIVKESEGAARTVDIVRILLFYALDPLLISGGKKPAGREIIDVSVKKLFSELIKLSETAPDPFLPRPASKPASNPVQQKKQVKFAEDELLQNVEMKRGDWMCPKIDMNLTVCRGKIRPLTAHVLKPRRDTKGTKMSRGCIKLNIGFLCLDVLEDFVLPKVLGFQVQAWRAFAAVLTLLYLSYFIAVLIFLRCNFLNFARNVICLKCKEDGPKSVHGGDVEMKKGDWICSECNFMNFSRNTRCLKCKAGGPKRLAVDEVEMKKGDWNCPQCFFMNFASNKNCLRCREQRPKRLLYDGEWECPSCDYLNYSRNKVCLKCKSERPKEDATAYEEQVWRRPY
ncbi:hypothetical protein Patl1_19609 [Pistacia atlantica]|uniref:Uncharacterized protein n=1 Tax=Pistacia atlantica TaxID=434234 RepID=A0ACC1C163_9ROSI|nr:hypothetical protein Patl1_19609 [Pistacia atlantica]